MNELPDDFHMVDPYLSNREQDYFQLRWEVLREPWGQPKGTEKDDLEISSIHRLIVTSEGTPVATGRLQLNEPAVAQIRYMAVHPDYRGRSLGKKLIAELEDLAKNAGAAKVILQARENAVPFYRACAYTVVKKTFLLYDSIQHFLMEKKL